MMMHDRGHDETWEAKDLMILKGREVGMNIYTWGSRNIWGWMVCRRCGWVGDLHERLGAIESKSSPREWMDPLTREVG
jgi:hypothetical protein